MKDLLKVIVPMIMSSLLELFPKEKVLEVADKILDKVEDKVKESENVIDDMTILPLIKKLIREPFGIEDND